MDREGYGQAMREGHLAAWAGRWRDSVGHYRRAAAALPSDVAARSSLATALSHAGQPAEALDLFEELAAERGDDTTTLLRVAELRHRVGRADEGDDAYLTLGELYVGHGQREKALGIWNRLLTMSGHRRETTRRVAEAALAAGVDDVSQRARLLADRAEEPGPAQVAVAADGATPRQDAWAEQLAARLREASVLEDRWTDESGAETQGPARDRLDTALAALALRPGDPRVARRIGVALRDAGNPSAAAAQLRDALDVAEVTGELGVAVALVDDLVAVADDPLPLLRRKATLALRGEQSLVAAAAHLDAARILAARGETQSAVAAARSARTVAPLDASVQSLTASLLLDLGARADADDALRRAFQLAPRDVGHVLRYAEAAAQRDAHDELFVALDALEDAEWGADLPPLDSAAASAGALLLRGVVRIRQADARARDDLARASAASTPLGPRAARELARWELSNENPAGARTALSPWLRDATFRADDGDAPEELARLALRAADTLGDDALGLTALDLLVHRQPEDATLGALYAERLAVGGRTADAATQLSRLAGLARRRGDLETAGSLFEASAALDQGTGDAALAAADLARERGDADAARRLFLLAADAGGDGAARALLAAAEFSAPSARIEILARAKAAAPRDAEPRRLLVAALVASGQVGLAAAEGIELAEMLVRAGDDAGASAALDQAARLDPWNGGIAALRSSLAARATGGNRA